VIGGLFRHDLLKTCDPCANNVALFHRRGSHPRLKYRTILRRQPNFRSFGNHPNVDHESAFGETGVLARLQPKDAMLLGHEIF
jgi:hypothetical protein